MPRQAASTRSAQHVLINYQLLGSAVASVTLPASGSIPGGFTHLRLIIRGRSARTSSLWDTAYLRFNADTGSHYEWATSSISNAGVQALVAAASDTALRVSAALPATSAAAGVFGRVIVDIPDYLDTSTVAKTATALSVSASQPFSAAGGSWIMASGTAITSIFAAPTLGNWVAGSAFWLYGLS
jgi:hypothetical protein